MKIKVFLFHRVNPERDPLWDPVDPAHFRRVIAYLKKNYTLFLLEDLIYKKEFFEQNFKKPLAAIVFDDGYKDFIQYAAPILDELKTPASMYIITEAAASGRPPWTYVLDYSFIKTKSLSLDWQTNLLPQDMVNVNWLNKGERIKYGKCVKPILKNLSHSERAELVSRLEETFSDVEIPTDLFMNWDDIRQISAAGFEIGSHTVTHPLLASVEDHALLNQELVQSMQILQAELGRRPIAISYPGGSYNSRVKQAAQVAGYQLGLVVNQHSYDRKEQDVFEIPRIEIYNESMFKTKMRIKGVVTNLKKILGR